MMQFFCRPCCVDRTAAEDEPLAGATAPKVGCSDGDFRVNNLVEQNITTPRELQPGPPAQVATEEPAVPAAEQKVDHELTLEIHSAALDRSFAKFGWMDPYAIILADGTEVERTAPASGAHKSPNWNVAHRFSAGHIPHHITVQVWDKNNFHKDVFCGGTSVPCAEDMGSFARQSMTLTKKQERTGVLVVSIQVVEVPRPGSPASPSGGLKSASKAPIRQKSLGGEFDHLMAMITEDEAGTDTKKEAGTAMTLVEVHHPEGETAAAAVAAPALKRAKSDDLATVEAALCGTWKCVDTFGLEDFLKATGVGLFQRKIALAAAWPKWDFTSEGKIIKFVNHSAIGDLFEDIPIGTEYQWKDGHKNQLTCKAEWKAAVDGGCLTINRSGTIGNYTEERTVNGDQLKFVLTHGSGVKWGRCFERVA